MKHLIIPVFIIILCSCQHQNKNEPNKSEDLELKALQDKYVSADSEINTLRKKFDAALLKHDSLTAYTENIEVKFEKESYQIRKLKQKINLALLRQTMTNTEKLSADSLIHNLDSLVESIKRKGTN